jgi:hypothetical protein
MVDGLFPESERETVLTLLAQSGVDYQYELHVE